MLEIGGVVVDVGVVVVVVVVVEVVVIVFGAYGLGVPESWIFNDIKKRKLKTV